MEIGQKSDPGKECVLERTLDGSGSIFGALLAQKATQKAPRNLRENGDDFGSDFGEKRKHAGGRGAPLY